MSALLRIVNQFIAFPGHTGSPVYDDVFDLDRNPPVEEIYQATPAGSLASPLPPLLHFDWLGPPRPLLVVVGWGWSPSGLPWWWVGGGLPRPKPLPPASSRPAPSRPGSTLARGWCCFRYSRNSLTIFFIFSELIGDRIRFVVQLLPLHAGNHWLQTAVLGLTRPINVLQLRHHFVDAVLSRCVKDSG